MLIDLVSGSEPSVGAICLISLPVSEYGNIMFSAVN
jgi:hypothetical protein